MAQKTRYENRLWSNLTVPAIIRSLESTFGSHLDHDKVNLELIAERVCNNTLRPFRDTEDSQEWVDQLCGQNLRWESIALLWSVLRRIPGSFEPVERNELHILETGTSNKEALAFVRQSIAMARYFTLANVIILDLVHQKTIMESMIIGDASKSFESYEWRSTDVRCRPGSLDMSWRSRYHDDLSRSPYGEERCTI